MTSTGTPVFDKQEQYDAMVPMILPGETLHAVYDLKGAGTGFIGVTTKRIIFYDKNFLGRRKAMTSVPFSKVTALSAIDEGGLFSKTSELVLKTGSEAYDFEFRGRIRRVTLTELS